MPEIARRIKIREAQKKRFRVPSESQPARRRLCGIETKLINRPVKNFGRRNEIIHTRLAIT